MRSSAQEPEPLRKDASGFPFSCELPRNDHYYRLIARETIWAPILTAHSVMDEEESGGIIFGLCCLQPRVVSSPKGTLPGPLEEIALRHVRSGLRDYFPQFVHRLGNRGGLLPGNSRIGLMPGNTRVGRWTPAGNDRQGEGLK